MNNPKVYWVLSLLFLLGVSGFIPTKTLSLHSRMTIRMTESR